MLEYVNDTGSVLKSYKAILDGEVVKLEFLHEWAITKISSWAKSPEKYWKDPIWTEQDQKHNEEYFVDKADSKITPAMMGLYAQDSHEEEEAFIFI